MHIRPARLQHIVGIGVDQMGAVADAAGDLLRLENLDVNIAPDPEAIRRFRRAKEAGLPFALASSAAPTRDAPVSPPAGISESVSVILRRQIPLRFEAPRSWLGACYIRDGRKDRSSIPAASFAGTGEGVKY